MTDIRIVSLFSGAAGLDVAVEHMTGGRVVAVCEPPTVTDKRGKVSRNHAVDVLAARCPGVPNLGDVCNVDWAPWRGRVHVMCGGFPCQDVSAAGLRAGMVAGSRSGLWAQFAHAIADVAPPVVIIENVLGLLSAKTDVPGVKAIDAVLADLTALGYRSRRMVLAADNAGAPHLRKRVFILAVRVAGDPVHTALPWPGRSALHLLPTPRASRGASTTETAYALGGVRDDIGDAQGNVVLLPTPGASDGGGGRAPRESGGTRPSGSKKAVHLTDLPLLLPTPVASHSGNSPEVHLRKKPGRTRVTDLAVLVENGLLATGGELLPTPVARDHKGVSLPSRTGGDGLTEAVVRLLPTPAAADGDRGPDYARAGRASSGGDDMVTLAARAHQRGTVDWGRYAAAIARWEALHTPAPTPVEPNRNGNMRLAPRFSEWMMGWPAGWVTDLDMPRSWHFRLIGNGVVAHQACAALELLGITDVLDGLALVA